ncbi:hypothetical conserved protein [Candidatus Nitrosoglobus terrae]|uniref:Hypothetical conserved protein n=1 Tax=Candidatus Nitrosoglobus terrae TaxID=1630141 RepID=A0A1Q2SL10_9GAMM|nr:hypothetical protein [Candidatus Nitrosoglobus terrae]BAW79804.1 hypothetical conserved protein [Candidatus Nitrosoglobus terrae]
MNERVLASLSKKELSIPSGLLELTPAFTVIIYPHFLHVFHHAVGAADSSTPIMFPLAILSLLATIMVPVTGIIFAWKFSSTASTRRLAYASVLSPALYTLLGTTAYMLHSPIPDEWIWTLLWIGFSWLALTKANLETSEIENVPHRPRITRWRTIHGIGATIAVIFIFFHLTNHFFGLFGAHLHDQIRKAGEIVYQSTFGEPILVALFLFMAGSGLRLIWHWSAARQDFYRTFQLAAGAFLFVFLMSHMTAVFILARTYLDITPDWIWATGGKAGIIHDPWNIRLLPYYLLSVFFALTHLASGTRVVLLHQGTEPSFANRLWIISTVVSLAIAAIIIAAVTGVRVSI